MRKFHFASLSLLSFLSLYFGLYTAARAETPSPLDRTGFRPGAQAPQAGSNLYLGERAIRVVDFSKSPVLDIRGNLNVSRGAILYAVSTNPAIDTAIIRAYSIFNSGLITTVLPQGGISGYSNAIPGLNLSLIATHKLINSGQISSAGNLNLCAGELLSNGNNSIVQAINNLNVFTPVLVNAGTMSAQNSNVTINSASLLSATLNNLPNSAELTNTLSNSSLSNISTQITNSGSILAAAGNIDISAIAGSALAIDNNRGLIKSTGGDISLDGSYGKNVSLFGGTMQGEAVAATAPGAKVDLHAERIDGAVTITGAVAAASAEHGDLNIAQLKLSDDPIFALRGGGTLTIQGFSAASASDFVALSEGDIVLSGTVNTSGGSITAVAGHLFKGENGDPCTHCSGKYSILGSSPSGGTLTIKTVNLEAGSNSVTLQADKLYVDFIPGPAANVYSRIHGGKIVINADSIGFDSVHLTVSADGATGGTVDISTTNTLAIGNRMEIHADGSSGSGGRISINSTADILLVSPQALTVDAYGSGTGGTISLSSTDSIALSSLAIKAGNNGDGGKIILSGADVGAFGHADLSVNGSGAGSGGQISLHAKGSVLLGSSEDLQLDSLSLSATGGSANSSAGDGGSIQVSAFGLVVDPNSLNVKALGNQGKGGTIDLSSSFRDLTLNGSIEANGPTGGGSIKINTETLKLPTDRSVSLTACSLASGTGGSISVTSSMSTQYLLLGHDNGNLNINTDGYNDGGTVAVSVANLSIGSGGISSQGLNGGSVDLKSDVITIGSNSINCSGSSGVGGHITIKSKDLTLVDSSLDASAYNGGIIEISSDKITAYGKNLINVSGTLLSKGGLVSIQTSGSLALGDQSGQIELSSIGGGNQVVVDAKEDLSLFENAFDISQSNNPFGGASITLSAGKTLSLFDGINVSGTANGNGGIITISASTLALAQDKNIHLSANAAGIGSGGTVKITTGNPLSISNAAGNLSLSATGGSELAASGNGGSIQISSSGPLDLSAEAISVAPLGLSGTGGNYDFKTSADFILHGSLSADAAANGGNGGVINIFAAKSFIADNGSAITARAFGGNGNGGKISATFFTQTIQGTCLSGLQVIADASGNGAGGQISLSTARILGSPVVGGDILLGESAGEISLSARSSGLSTGGCITVLAQNNITVNQNAIALNGLSPSGGSGRLILVSSYNNYGANFAGKLTVNGSISILNSSGLPAGEIYLSAGRNGIRDTTFGITINSDLQAGLISVVNWGDKNSTTVVRGGVSLTGNTVAIATPSLIVDGDDTAKISINAQNLAIAVQTPGASNKLVLGLATTPGTVSILLPDGMQQNDPNFVLRAGVLYLGSNGEIPITTIDDSLYGSTTENYKVSGTGSFGSAIAPLKIDTVNLEVHSGGDAYLENKSQSAAATIYVSGEAQGNLDLTTDVPLFVGSQQPIIASKLFINAGVQAILQLVITDYLSIKSTGYATALVKKNSAPFIEIGDSSGAPLLVTSDDAIYVNGNLSGSEIVVNSKSSLIVNGNAEAKPSGLQNGLVAFTGKLGLELNGSIVSENTELSTNGLAKISGDNSSKSLFVTSKDCIQLPSSKISTDFLAAYCGSVDLQSSDNSISRLMLQSAGTGKLSSTIPIEIILDKTLVFNPDLNKMNSVAGDFVVNAPGLIFSGPLEVGANLILQSNAVNHSFSVGLNEAGSLNAVGAILINQETFGPVSIGTLTPGGLQFGGSHLLSFAAGAAVTPSVVSSSGPIKYTHDAAGQILTSGGSLVFSGKTSFASTTAIQSVFGASEVEAASSVDVTGDLTVRANAIINPNGFKASGIIYFDLQLGRTITNPNGDIVLTSNMLINSGGSSLTLLAAGNIVANGVPSINLSTAKGLGGQLNIFAGSAFEQDPLDQSKYLVTGASTMGGDISLSKVSINTSSTSKLFTAVDGGDVNLIANPGTAAHGTISVGEINTSSAYGTAGNVNIIGAGGITVSGSINTTGAASGANVLLAGSSAKYPIELSHSRTIQEHSIFSTGSVTSGSAIFVSGGISTGSSQGNGGDISIYAATKIQTGSLTSSSVRHSGNIVIGCNDGSIFTGEVNTSALPSSDSAVAGAGGNFKLLTGGSAKINGSVITTGGIPLAAAHAILGDGGKIEIYGKKIGNVGYGSVVIKGYLDSSGGSCSDCPLSTGGAAGGILIDVGSIQVAGVKANKTGPASIIASGGSSLAHSGSNGNVLISTYGTQELPSNLNLGSSLLTEFALPGAAFTVGNPTLVNGTRGIIISGSSVVKNNTPGTGGITANFISADSTPGGFKVGSVSIVPSGGKESINLGGNLVNITQGSTSRTKVTAAEALVLYLLVRGESQSIGLNGKGQLTESNPAGASSNVVIHSADIPPAITALNLKPIDSQKGIDFTINGDYPTLTLTGTASNINGNLLFNTGGTVASVFSSMPLRVAAAGSITSDADLSISSTVSKGALSIVNNGTISAKNIIPIAASAGISIENNSGGSLIANSILIPTSFLPNRITVNSRGVFQNAKLVFDNSTFPLSITGGNSANLTGAGNSPLTIRLGVKGDVSLAGNLASSSSIDISATTINSQPTNLTVENGAQISSPKQVLISATGSLNIKTNATIKSGTDLKLSGLGISIFPSGTLEAVTGLAIDAKGGPLDFAGSVSSSRGVVSLSSSAAVSLDGKLVAGTTNGNLPFQPLLNKLAASSIKIVGASVDLGTRQNTEITASGGDVNIVAKSGDLILGSASGKNSMQAYGGNVILLAKGNILGASGNVIKASSQGGSSAIGGGIELGAGVTNSSIWTANSQKSGTVKGVFASDYDLRNPTSGANTSGVVLSTSNGSPATTANINLSSSGSQQAILELQGGKQVFHATGSANKINLDGGSFSVTSLKPVCLRSESDIRLRNLVSENNLNEMKARTIAHLITEGSDEILALQAEDEQNHLKAAQSEIVLHNANVFIRPVVKTMLISKFGTIECRKGAQLYLVCDESSLRIVNCGNSKDVWMQIGAMRLLLETGQELMVSKASEPLLFNDSIARRNHQSFVLSDSNLQGTVCDASLVSILSNVKLLSVLRHPRNKIERELSARLCKNAMALQTVTGRRGAYQIMGTTKPRVKA